MRKHGAYDARTTPGTPRGRKILPAIAHRAHVALCTTSSTRSTVRPHPISVREHHTVRRSLLTSFLRSAGRSRTPVVSGGPHPQTPACVRAYAVARPLHCVVRRRQDWDRTPLAFLYPPTCGQGTGMHAHLPKFRQRNPQCHYGASTPSRRWCVLRYLAK
jgi:hypothetical protein